MPPPKKIVALSQLARGPHPNGAEGSVEQHGMGGIEANGLEEAMTAKARTGRGAAESLGRRNSEAPSYGHRVCGAAYWDAWHAAAGPEAFDWYVEYSRLREVFRNELPSPAEETEILDVGCGSSEVPSCLFNDGWHFVTAIDKSAEAIACARRSRCNADKHEMQFLQMDVCSLEFPDECFNVVFDKATFDTIATSSPQCLRVESMLSEIYRVLLPGGIYIMVSHASPAHRLQHLVQDPRRAWRIQVARLPKIKPTQVTTGLRKESDGSSTPDHGFLTGDAMPNTSSAEEASNTCFFIYLCTKHSDPTAARRRAQTGPEHSQGHDTDTQHKSLNLKWTLQSLEETLQSHSGYKEEETHDLDKGWQQLPIGERQRFTSSGCTSRRSSPSAGSILQLRPRHV
eukprot:TRINITY_DN49649_c0_g1_i1.p1 TRINITY_DN49649_c0_g1~~TRINITY_DN49649_c0_g1_i1.p1  ORF type:complete len:409 (+),score=68.74 TRINITY_DN49649_c0_g1_i1:31-1227(+)